jgi:hypothetical protein
VITTAQVAAISRYVGTFIAGAATAAAGWGIISTDNAATIQTSLGHIVNGVQEITVGVAPLAAIVLGWYGTWTASHKAQARAVAATGAIIVTTPLIAATTAEKNIVSSNDYEVVPK